MPEGGGVPGPTAFHHVGLTVTDLGRSADWYCRVLGFAVDARIQGETFRRVRLRHPESGLVVSLTRHDATPGGPFHETRPGLDHLAFQVPTVADVEDWERRFDAHGVEHSGVGRESARVARIFFRDPDNIQLEVLAVER